jgi:hypothetical protein
VSDDHGVGYEPDVRQNVLSCKRHVGARVHQAAPVWTDHGENASGLEISAALELHADLAFRGRRLREEVRLFEIIFPPLPRLGASHA